MSARNMVAEFENACREKMLNLGFNTAEMSINVIEVETIKDGFNVLVRTNENGSKGTEQFVIREVDGIFIAFLD